MKKPLEYLSPEAEADIRGYMSDEIYIEFLDLIWGPTIEYIDPQAVDLIMAEWAADPEFATVDYTVKNDTP